MWRDRVRILLVNRFKDRLVSGYTARDIPILFEHVDLDAEGVLGREVPWGLGRTCRWLRCRAWSPHGGCMTRRGVRPSQQWVWLDSLSTGRANLWARV